MSNRIQSGSFPARGRIIGSSPKDVAEAADLVLGGDIVGMPTETVYGLAADATQGEAIAKIYEAKGRPVFNPLISHVSDLKMAQEHGIFSEAALQLARAFWPGPLTLIVPVRPGSPISALSRAGLDSVGLRVPAHPIAQDLIRSVGRPLAAPSANRSGRISPTTAEDVMSELGQSVSIILNGGGAHVGVESTIISTLDHDGELQQLRPGGVSHADLEKISKARIMRATNSKAIISPGLLESHYAPLALLRMNCVAFQSGDAILAFGPEKNTSFPPSSPVYNLSPDGNLRQAAAHLFTALRELDRYAPHAIAVVPIPETGLGEAINDRLRRAAAPR